MENLPERITIDPELCNGKPSIRNKRITVNTVIQFLNAGDRIETILHQYPSLEKEDILACTKFSSGLNRMETIQ